MLFEHLVITRMLVEFRKQQPIDREYSLRSDLHSSGRRELKERKLVVRRQGDTTDRSNWPEQHRWLHDTMLTFDRVFRPIISDLDATEWIASAEGP